MYEDEVIEFDLNRAYIEGFNFCTSTQICIMEGLCRGLTLKRIAKKLKLHHESVKRNLRQIAYKLFLDMIDIDFSNRGICLVLMYLEYKKHKNMNSSKWVK